RKTCLEIVCPASNFRHKHQGRSDATRSVSTEKLCAIIRRLTISALTETPARIPFKDPAAAVICGCLGGVLHTVCPQRTLLLVRGLAFVGSVWATFLAEQRRSRARFRVRAFTAGWLGAMVATMSWPALAQYPLLDSSWWRDPFGTEQ